MNGGFAYQMVQEVIDLSKRENFQATALERKQWLELCHERREEPK